MSDHPDRVSSLTEEQYHQLADRLVQQGGRRRGRHIPLRKDSRTSLPAAFAQERMWFYHQLDPTGAAFNIPMAVRFRGNLNVIALEQCIREVVRRHEILRTSFQPIDGRLYQVIGLKPTLLYSIVDMEHLDRAGLELEVRRLAESESSRPFDLTGYPLLRTLVIRLSSKEHVVIVTMPHIISDGWSVRVLIAEVGTLYEAYRCGNPLQLPELPLQYADFSEWQREYLSAEQLDELVSYWKRQLRCKDTALNLPTDRPRQLMKHFQGGCREFSLPADLFDLLIAVGRRERATLFMTLLAGFQVLLHRYTGDAEIPVGTIVANRNQREIEGLIGFFVNNLVIHTDLSGNPTFRELLRQVRRVTLEAYDHQDLPFEMLVEILQPVRDNNCSPLFQVMFVLQNVPLPPLAMTDLAVDGFEIVSSIVHFDLSLIMQETPLGLTGWLNYRKELFNDLTISEMTHNFSALLRELGTFPDKHLKDISIGDKDNVNGLIDRFNDDLSVE